MNQRTTASDPSRPRTDFSHLSKAQLIRQLRYAEAMMVGMRDLYRAKLECPEPFLFAHDHERGFSAAMDHALGYLTQAPPWWVNAED